jgi:hypothetical protein
VARVFWRAEAPWVLVRSDSGLAFAVPWTATDLPVPVGAASGRGDVVAPLLSPAALQALARFVCQRPGLRARGRSRR